MGRRNYGSDHSKGVCILIAPSLQLKIDYTYKNNSGRIVLINTTLNSLKLTLCNIYAPNGQSEQLEFIQELIRCLIGVYIIIIIINRSVPPL